MRACQIKGDLSRPILQGESPLAGRMLQPIIKTGVASAEEVDIDTPEQRLRLEAIAAGDAITGIALVNARAHKE